MLCESITRTTTTTILHRRERGQGNIHFPCSADHEQYWQPYPVDPNSAICDAYTYIHTYIDILINMYIHKYIHTYIS